MKGFIFFVVFFDSSVQSLSHVCSSITRLNSVHMQCRYSKWIIQQEFPGTNRQGLLLFFVTDGGKRAEFLCLFVFPHIPDISSLGNPRKQLVNAWVYGCILYTKKKKEKEIFFSFHFVSCCGSPKYFFFSLEGKFFEK